MQRAVSELQDLLTLMNEMLNESDPITVHCKQPEPAQYISNHL